METNSLYKCIVSWPKSTYDFGVNAYSVTSNNNTGFIAFEVYDGGNDWASEVVYADIVFMQHKRVICITHFFAVDFDSEISIEIDEINPNVLRLIDKTLRIFYGEYDRVCLFEEENTYTRECASSAVSCFHGILPQIAISKICKYISPKKPIISEKLRSVMDSYDLIENREAKVLQNLYEVIGYDGIDRVENEHELCSRVRDIIHQIIVDGEGSSNLPRFSIFTKFKI